MGEPERGMAKSINGLLGTGLLALATSVASFLLYVANVRYAAVDRAATEIVDSVAEVTLAQPAAGDGRQGPALPRGAGAAVADRRVGDARGRGLRRRLRQGP
jgi:hypothetical protein